MIRTARFGTLGQRVALGASLWVAAGLAIAVGAVWWQFAHGGGLDGVNTVLLLPALAFASVSFGLRTLRWHFFLGIVGATPPLLTSLRTQLIGFSLTVTPGKVGELYKCYLMELRTGVPTARTAPIVLFEKMMDAAAFAGLAVLAAAVLPTMAESVSMGARTLLLLGAVAVGIGLALRWVSPDRMVGVLLRLAGRSRLGRRLASAAGLALAGGVDLLNGRVLTTNLVMSFAARACDGLALAWTAWAFGIDLPALAGIFTLNSAGALGGFSMLPGGIGVVEGSMSVALVAFGASASAALATTFLARLLTFWVWVAIGLGLLLQTSLARDPEVRAEG